MHTTNILLSTAILATLTACGGADITAADLAAQDQPATAAPKTALTAAEQAEFAAAKTKTIEGDYGVNRLVVAGKEIIKSDGKTDERDFRSLPAGLATLTSEYIDAGQKIPGYLRSLQGFRSGVAINYAAANHRMQTYDMYGVRLPAAELPSSGKVRYSGTIFSSIGRGTFTYDVDFNAKTGEGKIEGLGPVYGTIHLQQSQFVGSNDADSLIDGTASAAKGQSMSYRIWLAGHGTEEVVGFLVAPDDEPLAGFLGERGDISQ